MLATVAAVVGSSTAAWAHMSVQPGEVEGGGISVLSFRVPNERDDASTMKVQVVLPRDQALASVRTSPVPGWRIKTETRKLKEPIDLFGEQIDTVVSSVTWTAQAEGVGPGQFEDFDVSVGPLPKSGEIVFNAIQTYSSGEVVKWNEVAVDDSIELEHPAPVLTITAPEPPDAGSDEESGKKAGDGAQATVSPDDGTALSLVLSGLALVISVVALVLVIRRRV